MRHPGGADRRAAGQWREGADGHFQQCGRGRLWPGPAVGDPADQEDDFLVRGENKEFERQFLSGELELEFNPQGTLAERLRAGGAGIPAFFTRTGYGTVVAEGKETRQFGEHWYVMETALAADVSLVKAWKADKAGNLVFRKTARTFNPACAMAGKVCIAEVEEVVEIGAIDPDHVHLPGIYVDRIVHNPTPEKRIEQRTVRQGDK